MRAAAAITLALFLTACATVPPSQIAVSGVSDRLFCGREMNGVEISDEEIERFIEEVVEPRFPEGFTVWTAVGRWRGGEEKTLIIELVHPYGSRFDRAVAEIAEEYRSRFRQDAVMRVTTPALMEFIEE